MVEEIKVKAVVETENGLPVYSTIGAAGCDLKTTITEPYTLKPLERKLFPTGLRIQLPEGYKAQVTPRSGLALKHGITVLNTPGLIDEDYTGEIGVILINLSDKDFTVNPNDRIAQIIFNKYCRADFELVNSLDETERGDGGFGHTGLK